MPQGFALAPAGVLVNLLRRQAVKTDPRPIRHALVQFPGRFPTGRAIFHLSFSSRSQLLAMPAMLCLRFHKCIRLLARYRRHTGRHHRVLLGNPLWSLARPMIEQRRLGLLRCHDSQTCSPLAHSEHAEALSSFLLRLIASPLTLRAVPLPTCSRHRGR